MKYINIDSLLAEISADSPTGEDLEDDLALHELHLAAKEKPEQQYGDTIIPAEEPNWQEILEAAQNLLRRSKDLRLVMYLTQALMRLDGFQGLRDGLILTTGLIDHYWENLYPTLDEENDQDPTFRINTLNYLCDPETGLRFIREMPITASRAFGAFCFRDIKIARGDQSVPSDYGDPPSLDSIDAAFSDTDKNVLTERYEVIAEIVSTLQAMDASIFDKVGAARAMNFGPIHEVIKEVHAIVREYVQRRGLLEGSSVEEERRLGESSADVSKAIGLTGEIRTRADAIRLMDKISEYFEKHEPSSPVPILVQRAKRLVSKSFIEIIEDLAPRGLDEVLVFRGSEKNENQG